MWDSERERERERERVRIKFHEMVEKGNARSSRKSKNDGISKSKISTRGRSSLRKKNLWIIICFS